jgi:hypothetical protein
MSSSLTGWAERAWSGFRRWPIWLQIIAWIIGFLVLLPILTWKSGRTDTWLKWTVTGIASLFLLIIVIGIAGGGSKKKTTLTAKASASSIAATVRPSASAPTTAASAASPSPSPTPTPSPSPLQASSPAPTAVPVSAQPIDGGGCSVDFPVKVGSDGKARATDDPQYGATQALSCWASAAAASTAGHQTAEQFRVADVTKSFRDNLNTMDRASGENLQVSLDGSSGLVGISVQPSNFSVDTDALTIASQTSVVASRAVWTTYADAQTIQVTVLRNVSGTVQPVAVTVVSRATGSKFAYDQLKKQVNDDNKAFFCQADGYAIAYNVYTQLKNVGCLTGSTKGTLALDVGMAAPPTPTPSLVPTPVHATFDGGTKIVGKDIQPGTYRTRKASSECYWERLSGFSGTLGDIIENDNASGPAVVTVAATDTGFNSSRCATWTDDLSAITTSPTASFGDGTYIVGVDISPGTWQSSGSAGCYWERESNFSGSLDAILANDNASGTAIVSISPTDKGFKSSRCGTWTKIQ